MNAPVVIFCFNRPEHIRRTLDSLAENKLAEQSNVTIFVDGPRNANDIPLVNEVLDIVAAPRGFKSLTINKSDKNKGLAKSIMEGVSEVINEYGKVIVLEDDLVTSQYFLEYMNKSLNLYEEKKSIWHISGWNYPIQQSETNDTEFLWRTMNCWGWATWSDRWKFFSNDSNSLIEEFDENMKQRFNLEGSMNFWSQIELNHQGKLQTWAIFWYATIFKNDGLCLNSRVSLVENIGLDGSGTNCKKTDVYTSTLRDNADIYEIKKIEENNSVVEEIKKHMKEKYKVSFFNQVIWKLRRLVSKFILLGN